MQRKLNDEFIKEYSEEFSAIACNQFFESNQTISGKQILGITPSAQVNFFILKSLFRKWQDEMKRLESPFFDYKNGEVRKAMVQFMNTLSQHIEVKEEDFKPMLEGALVEALLFITDPAGYLSMEFEMLDVPVISDKITTPILRYFKIYKTELKEFFENNESATLDDFLEATEDLNEEMDVEGVTQAELLKFSKVLPISLQELFEEEFEEDDKGLEDGDLVEEILETDESELSIEEVFEESEPYEDEAEVEISDETEEVDDETEEKEVELEHEDIEDDLDIEETPDEETIEEDLPEDAIDLNDEEEDNEDDGEEVVGGDDSEEEIEETVNEKFAEDRTTINDKFSKKEEDTLATKLENKKVESVMDAISVNHRYMFAKELFEGDREAFVKAIEHIEKCGSFDEAVELLVQNYAKERAWDMNSDEVKELLKVIFRKFR
jgi:hypothetical protein